ncbi:MAG: helix-turn-helix transcriptional regulator [Acidobacteriota bacterium]|nr:helix-turn-helix transcriptional regulator [Acidobacteriota bacterium]
MDGRIFYLRKRIQENLQYDWTVEELSKSIGISPPHLQRLFKSSLGMPPISYLRDLRLEKARALLEAEDEFYQVGEIGYKVGIFCNSHFTRDFKRKFGLTPSEYRRHYWEKAQAERQLCDR